MSSSANVRLSLGSSPDSLLDRLARRPRLAVISLLALASWLVVAAAIAGVASLV